MPNQKTVTFTVEGNHEFPFDMLRYDRCWPAREGEIASLAPHARSEMYRTTRRVTLCGLRAPTADRWKSFGWKVVSYEGER